jgi:hypothetical protein
LGDTIADDRGGVEEVGTVCAEGVGTLIDGVFEAGPFSTGVSDVVDVAGALGVIGVVSLGSAGIATSGATGAASMVPASTGVATGIGIAADEARGFAPVWAYTPLAKQKSAAKVAICEKVTGERWNIEEYKLQMEVLTGAVTLRAGERGATKSLYFR